MQAYSLLLGYTECGAIEPCIETDYSSFMGRSGISTLRAYISCLAWDFLVAYPSPWLARRVVMHDQ